MIIYNEKEYQGKYTLFDNMLITINSRLSLNEIYERLKNGEDLSPEEASIFVYINGDGSVKMESNKIEEKAYVETKENSKKFYIGMDAILTEDDLEEIAEVDTSGVYRREDFFDAYEKEQFGGHREGFDIKKFPFDMKNEKHRDALIKHLAIAFDAPPTIVNRPELSLDDMKKYGKIACKLYRDFGKHSVSSDNKIPTLEEMQAYEALTDYEKRLLATNYIHPARAMELKAALGNGAVITNDIYRKLAFFKGDVAKTIEARTAGVVPGLMEKFDAEFRKQGYRQSPRVLKEFIQGCKDLYNLKQFTDEQIAEFVSKFKLERFQTKISDKVSIAQSKNPSLIALTMELSVQELPQQLLRAMAVYIDQNNVHQLYKKGIVDWIKANKNTNVSEFVEMLDAADIIQRFDPEKPAKELKKSLDYELGRRDAKLFERKYGYKWEDNEIAIKGRHLVVEDGAYKMYMLAADDPRNFVTGYDTCCCQRWDDGNYHAGGKNYKIQVLKNPPTPYHNAGGSCVAHLTSDPFSANVVIVKKATDEVVGQSYVWVDVMTDTFVFDNIEYANDGKSSKYSNIIGLYAEQIPYKNVHLGMGCNGNQKLNGVGTVVKQETFAKLPTTVNNFCHYSDYHVGSAKILKQYDPKKGTSSMIKYPLDKSRFRATTAPDEPTKWDEIAYGPFSFLLNDYQSSIEKRLEMVEQFKNNPSEALQRQVVQRDPRTILALENPSKELQMYVWERNPEIAKEIKNPCLELQVAILEKDPDYLRKGTDVPENIVMGVLEKNGLMLGILPEERITTAICETALKNDGYAWYYVPDRLKTEELASIAVETSPKMVSLIESDFVTQDVQMIAARKEPSSILLLENNGCTRAQMAAVNRQPDLVLRIQNPSLFVARVAVQKSPDLIRRFQDKFPTLRKDAIERNGFVITDLRNVTQEEYELAVHQNPNVARMVPPPGGETAPVRRQSVPEVSGTEENYDFQID